MTGVWQELAPILAGTLAHSLWQGALVALLLVAFLNLTRDRAAQVRYVAACVALVLMLLTPMATFVVLAERMPPAMPASTVLPTAAPADGGTTTVGGLAGGSDVTPAGPSVERLVTTLWLAGVLAVALWHVAGGWRLRRWTRQDLVPTPPEWQERFDGLVRRLGLPAATMLRLSRQVDVPMVVGWLRPVVLVPASLVGGIPAAQLELILLHELAHVRRLDYLVNLLQIGVETLLFYHPAAWWIGGVVRREREHCCDDLVIAAGGHPLDYARALLQLEESRLPIPAPTATTGPLMARILRLTGGSIMPRRQSFWPRLAGVGLVALLLVGGSYMALAAQAERTPGGAVALLPTLAAAVDLDPVEGDFTLRQNDGQSIAHLEVYWARSGQSRLSFRLTEAEYDRIRATESPVSIAREAGRFDFQRETRRKGVFTFTPDADFLEFLDDRGVDLEHESEVFVMAATGMTRSWVEKLDQLGGRLDGEEIVAAGIHGVSPEFVGGLQEAGFADEDFETYLAMRIHGLDGEQVEGMRKAGFKHLSAADALSYKIHGLDHRYIHEMHATGIHLDPEELLSYKIHGVDPDYVKGLRDSGWDLSAEELLSWKIHGVKPSTADAMRRAGLKDVTSEDMLSWTIHGLDADYIRDLEAAGLDVDEAGDLLAMKIHGVSADYVERLQKLGIEGIDAESVLEARIHGVTTRWIEKLKDKGIDLPLKDYTKLRLSGVQM